MHAVPQATMAPAYPYYSWQPYQPYPAHIHPHYMMAYPPVYPPYYSNERFSSLQAAGIGDQGKEPYVVNIEQVTKQNHTYRTAIWTGEHFQVTVMSIPVGSDIGLEVHPDTDQFIRIEEGQGLVQMGDSKDKLDFEAAAYDDFAVMVPAGKWHNLTNTGNKPLKVYVIYAPPEHPFGTVHATKADAMASHE
ncbi:cupin domain-containing protein [Paenibacillus sp. 1P07SE]|uniref:cupin domain-containing protein n=1 Tax=Paenibacillus sp. 1P07SE TaxID=3132209 RepID=UPI0039A4B44F